MNGDNDTYGLFFSEGGIATVKRVIGGFSCVSSSLEIRVKMLKD